MNPHAMEGLWPRALRALLSCIALCLGLAAAPVSAKLAITPDQLNLPAGSYGLVRITGARGEIKIENKNSAVASTSLSNISAGSATLTVTGKAAGSTRIRIRDKKSEGLSLSVKVSAAVAMTVSPPTATLPVGTTITLTPSAISGSLSATSANTRVATVSVSANRVIVRGIAAGSTLVAVKDSKTTVNVPITVTSSSAGGGGTTPGAPGAARYALLAWNDLGMHCMDGKDYSVFSILPPYNNLHAQLVNASTGKAVTSNVSLSYEAVADPSGSINTSSAGKTNFWAWSRPLYGAAPATDVGLTGNATPSRTPRPLVLDAANGWFEAAGLPITPYDDNGVKNFYPTVKVTARNSSGQLLASTTAVLPVSDEITCAACHASRAASETNPARLAAKPAAGWVGDANAETDWKKNILRLHDEKLAGNAKYTAALAAKGMPGGLYAAALGGTPTLCAACHASNALPGTGMAGISALTSALHTNHGKVIDPATQLSLDSSSNRGACYLCHPGSVTKCLRGAMGNAVDGAGNATMGCQSCHGNMSKVGDAARTGWLQQPNCQACHYDGKRTLNALDAAGNLVRPADTRFATNPNTPSAGHSLFRFSKGHGGLQCEACHGATHAEYPSSHANDNLQSIALQGYAGTVRECTACHATLPISVAGGPHGMHSIGAAWVSKHGDLVEGQAAQCTACHGSDYRGSPLSQVAVARSYATEHGNRSFAAGQKVGCYDCHNGPKP